MPEVTAAVRNARKDMPLWDGKIVDPRYIPPAHRPAYLAQWGQWLRANPLYREPWMLELIAEMRRKATSAGRNSTAASQQSTPDMMP